nr:LUD domain-containing protein [Patulibacter sp. SYSU D01012]
MRAAERAAMHASDHPGPPQPPRSDAQRPDRTHAELVDLLAERVEDYRATVVRTDEAGVAAAVADALADLDPGDVAAPPGLPDAWRSHGWRDGTAASHDELQTVQAVVTACRTAIAETGTIVLDHDADQGPRRLTLVPDRHVCVVRTDQVVADVDDAFAVLRPAEPGRPVPPMTFVSGPSATSDIELQRVEGVHGPRTLVVVLVAAPVPG